MNKILLTAAVAATLLTVPAYSSAQDVTATPTPVKGQKMKEYREEVRELKTEMKGQVKDARQEMISGAKENRTELREERREMLKDITPGTRPSLFPTIRAKRQETRLENKGLFQTFQAKRAELVKSFRESVANLWNSVFGTK